MRAPKSMHRSRGASLVELMVAIVVMLLIGITAFGAASFATAMQRQAIGASSALGDATNAMAAVKYEAAQAGLGFFSEGAHLCARTNLSSGAVRHFTDEAVLPLSLSERNGFAVVDARYALALTATAAALTEGDTDLAAGAVALASYLPVSPGQTVLLSPPVGVDRPCTARTVTRVVASTLTTPQRLEFAATGAQNQAAFQNVSYPANSRVALLGELQWSRFLVEDGNLVMERPLVGRRAVIAKNVVAFSAQYGVGDGVTSAMQSWEAPQGAWAALTAAAQERVLAVRVGVVVRSAQREKPDAQGRCAATEQAPVLFEQPVAMSGDWQCFRYRSSTVVVPLRNLLLGGAV